MNVKTIGLFFVLALSILFVGQGPEQTVKAEGVSIQSCDYVLKYTYKECRDGVVYTYEYWENECDPNRNYHKLVKTENTGGCPMSVENQQ